MLFQVPLLLALASTIFSVTAAPIHRRGSGLQVSNDEKDWPSTSTLEAALVSSPNGAFFWSGRNGDVSVEEHAATVAAAAGGATLESQLAAHNLIMPAFDVRNSAAVKVWKDASDIWAKQAKGSVFVVLGSSLREGNVFVSLELPALRKNKAVTSVTKIDSQTGAKTLLDPADDDKIKREDEEERDDKDEESRDFEDDEYLERDDKDEELERDDEEDLEEREPKAAKAKAVKASKPKAVKAAKPAKPKAVKVAKPKAVKAAKPAKVKAVKAAKPAKVKAVKAAKPAKAVKAAKPKAVKAAKPAKVKATKTKAAKATKATKAAKATKVKAAAKASTSNAVVTATQSSAGCISHPIRCN